MNSLQKDLWDWKGDYLYVKVLYSKAGIATQILVYDIEEELCFLIDIGDGILRDLVSLPEKYYENIHAILCTHGHFDHIGGLFSFLGFLRMINRNKKLLLIYPPKVIEIEGIVRTFQESYSNSIPYEIKLNEIIEKIHIKNITISAFPVQHRGSIVGGKKLPNIPSVGYIIEKKGERILYTGDTGYFEDLKKHITDVDYALIEGTYKEKKTPFHLSIPEAEKLGKLAKNYKIIHQHTSRNE